MRTSKRLAGAIILAAGVLLLLGASAAHARKTPEQKCQKARYDAAAKYGACEQKVLGKWFGGVIDSYAKLQPPLSKCRTKYTDTWAKLQKKAAGTGATCDNPRFNDNGDGTVTDRLTGLQWEKKTDDGTVHDKDTSHPWSATPPYTAANGTAFTTFLIQLNNPFGCFAGHCDWRLPTIAELQTILLEPYSCMTSPCVDQDRFGPTAAFAYWSATTDPRAPVDAWYVNFVGGFVADGYKPIDYHLRAVRSGL